MSEERRLSYEVKRPRQARADDLWLSGEIKLPAVPCRLDLNDDDKVRIVVTTLDGELLGESVATVDGVAFKPIRNSGTLVGHCRTHKAKVI